MMIKFYKFWNSLEKPLAIQNPGAEENTVMTDHNKNAEPYESLRNSCQFLTNYIRGRYTDTYSFTFLLIVTTGRPMVNGKCSLQLLSL
jgi:hypothetical protein